jgi:hypothetical protein
MTDGKSMAVEFNNIADITFSPSTRVSMRMRDYLEKFTREARGGQEEYWQEKLEEFDSDLHLRWSHVRKQWLIVYDHYGKVEVIRSFSIGGFGEAFKYVKYNSILTSRSLRQMKKKQDEEEGRRVESAVSNAGAEFGEELYHATRGRVMTDSVKNDDF